jgi:acyl carrier protein phosphodiesterase
VNYLFHLYLAEPTEEGLLGGLLGDFVKGRLVDGAWPEAMRRGIELHRRIDTFAHTNPVARRSLTRLDPGYRHYRGILIDVFYDHFLASDWSRHAEMPLEDFARRVYHALERRHQILPPELQRIAPRMIAHRWLESYRDPATIAIVLERISGRLSRPNPLASASDELHRHYRELKEDFNDFLPQALAFARQ